MSGGTDLALEITKKNKTINSLIYLGNNKDLNYANIKNNFLYPALSAMAPIIGEIKATDNAVIVIALDHRAVPIISFEAITFVKKVLYMKVITSVVYG